MDEETDSPTYLFKYRVADRYSLDMLNGDLYFALPQQLNDPTDFKPDHSAILQFRDRVKTLEQEIETLKEEAQAYQKVYEEMQDMKVYLLNQADDMPPEKWLREIESEKIAEIDRLTNQPLHRGRPKTLKSLERAFYKKFEDCQFKIKNLERLKQTWEDWQEGNLQNASSNEMSVLCLTTKADNYQMWKEYADGFRGVCIGFDQGPLIDALLGSGCDIEGPIRVVYRKMTIEDLLNPRFYRREDNRYRYKSKKHSTEREVRFVRKDGFGIVKVTVSCIKEIILGERHDPKFREDLKNTIRFKFLPATVETDMLCVYQAFGDSEGRVHIEPDEEITSLISKWWSEIFGGRTQVTDLPGNVFSIEDGTQPMKDIPLVENPLTEEEIPDEDELPTDEELYLEYNPPSESDFPLEDNTLPDADFPLMDDTPSDEEIFLKDNPPSEADFPLKDNESPEEGFPLENDSSPGKELPF